MTTGFFGKMPTSGDFVARSLAPGLRPFLDRWLTHWVARFSADPDAWPDGGIRGVLEGPGGPVLMVIAASRDATGRAFPLAACTALAGADLEAADRWADAAAPALAAATYGEHTADTLLDALVALAAQGPGDPGLVAPMLWTKDLQGPPEQVLERLFPVSSD